MAFRQRNNLDIANMSQAEILNNFKIYPEVLLKVEEELKVHLEPVKRKVNDLSVREKILITLKHLGSNSILRMDGEAAAMSTMTIWRYIHKVCALIAHRFYDEEIALPSIQDLPSIKQKFTLYGLPPVVIGCIDGSLINIKAPKEYEHQYVDRHGKHSVNLSIISGPDSIVYWADCSYPGSVGDARVFRNSELYARLTNQELFPEPSVLLGDSAYANSPFLITPIMRDNTEEERRFLRAHKRTRAIVERTLGQIKRMFPILQETIRTCNVIHATNIIKTCLILFNMRKKYEIARATESDSESSSDEDIEDNENDAHQENEEDDNLEEEPQLNQRAINRLFEERTQRTRNLFLNAFR